MIIHKLIYKIHYKINNMILFIKVKELFKSKWIIIKLMIK